MAGHPRAQDEPQDLCELVEAARRMVDGEFRELVAVQAKGEIGRLAYFINQTMRNLQQLKPVVGTSSRKLPQMTGQLSKAVKAAEMASVRVLNEIERIVEEQISMDRELQLLSELLQAAPGDDAWREEAMQALTWLRELHSRARVRALEIMSAMQFEDITAQRIQKSLAMVTEVENRLLRLLVMFNIPTKGGDEGEGESRWKALGELAAASKSGEMDQEMVDRLLAEFGQKAR